ncbi:MAG TPA: PAS domain S-box protein, partial [Telluria sp.]|nr:PAS domain S-box protein [Telluria sp.]
GALLLVVCGGLAVPAFVGGYLLIGVQERQAAVASLNDSLQRNADVLALGMQEPLWNMNPDAAQSLAESVMRDPSVVRVQVRGQSEADFVDVRSSAPPAGRVYRAERDIIMRGERIGRVELEMDDSKSVDELHAKQARYAIVLAGQLAVSLLLIVLFLKGRLLSPLRSLMRFSDRLSRGEFGTPLELKANDELGRLGKQMDRMRVAIRDLFEDIGRREERFRTIVTQVPGAVFRARPGGSIEFVSDAIEEISGYTAAQFIRGTTDNWTDIICPEDRRLQHRLVKDAIMAQRPYAVEYRIIDAFGTERWVLESGQPQGDPNSPDFRIDGIISDISERKHNEVQIEELLAEQSAILDNVMFGVMFVRDRRIVSVNRHCEELFGYDNSEMVGASTALLYDSQQEFEAAGHHYPRLALGETAQEERAFRHSSGRQIWCLVSGRAIDPQRPQDGCIWVFADVTERRQAEEKLRLAATVLEHIADGVMVIDLHGRIVATNPAFTQITGFTEAEAMGQRSSLMRAGFQDEAFYAQIWRDLAETGFWRGEIWNTRKNGEAYLEWLTVSAVRDDEGKVTHYVGVFSDITKAKESQEKLDHLAHHD